METDEKALYLAAWYLIRPHWVFKNLFEAAEAMARSIFSSEIYGVIYFQQLGRYSTKVCKH